MFCIDGADDAVVYYFRSCEIRYSFHGLPWVVYEVAVFCYYDVVGVSFLWAVVYHDVGIYNSAVFRYPFYFCVI